MIWGIPIVVYLFLAGMAAGAFVVGALAARNGCDNKKFQLANRLVVLVATGIGLVCLMVDATAGFQNPLRFLFLVSNLRSVMAWGVIFLSVFVVIDLVSMAIILKRSKPNWAVDVCGIVAALCVALYTGVLLGVSEAFPLWNLAVLPPLFLVSAASTGLAACTLVSHWAGTLLGDAFGVLRRWQMILPLCEMVIIAILIAVTGSAGTAGASTAHSLLAGVHAPLMWCGLVAVGLVVPIVMSRADGGGLKVATAGGSADVAAGSHASSLAVVEALCVLVGGFILRYLVVVAAIPVSTPVFGL